MDTQKEPETFDVSLFAYAYPSEDNSRSMSEDQIIKSEVGLKAENLYSSKNYVDYLQYVESQNIVNASPKFHLYTISSLIQLGDFGQVLDLANKELCKEIKCRNNIDWYKAIASIGNKEYSQGLSILKTIGKDNDHLFNSDANKLIFELEKYITNLK